MSLGVRIVCIALAGTVGAMGMLGYRRGGITEPFSVGGSALLPRATDTVAVLAGLAVHVAWITLWSALAAALVQRLRWERASIPAIAVAALAFGVSIIVPLTIGGPMAALPTPARALVHVVLGICLILGMRLAPRR